jgi:hypothetical protein
MKSPGKGELVSSEDAQQLREIIWCGDNAALIEEVAMVYSACKGALYDIRSTGRCSSTNIDFLNRQKHEALGGLYAIGVETEYIDAVNDGTYLNK